MKLIAIPYKLNFIKPFHIAHGIRSTTDTVFVKAEQDDIAGWGEAATPPYLIENSTTVINFVESFNVEKIERKEDLDITLFRLHSSKKNYAAKAAIETALLDWYGKFMNISVYDILKIPFQEKIETAITIPIGNKESFIENINKASHFNFLKIKLGSTWDDGIIELIPDYVNKPFAIDANQAWQEDEAVDKIKKLFKAGAKFIEQPLKKNALKEQKWLKAKSLLPIFADESIQTVEDLKSIEAIYDGINIKLVKCGGLTKAIELIIEARKRNLKILIGCMSESTCAITAAAHLSSYADFIDLDGPFLINNDPFEKNYFDKGNILIKRSTGIGVKIKSI
jgi:L-Ala-D/L-Glu epimerase